MFQHTVIGYRPPSAFFNTMVPPKPCLSVTLILLLFGTTLHRVDSASREVHLQLLRDLLDNYEKPFMRPVNDTTQTVEVGLRFTPIFSSLDETEEELNLRGMLALKWTDDRLRWNPTDYDGINETNIPLSVKDEQKVWIPEIFLNECLSTEFQSIFTETTGVSLIHTGEIHWYTLANTKTYCTVKNDNFPFDVQICPLTFTTWMYQSNEQTFYTIDDLVKNDTYKDYEMGNPLWTSKIKNVIESTITYACESCKGEKQSYVRYELELVRGESGLLVLIYIAPSLVITALTTLVTCLPHDGSADAPAYALTCVLTLFVYLIYMYSTLPPTGGAHIGIFMLAMVIGGMFAVFYAVFFKTNWYLDGKSDKADGKEQGTPNYQSVDKKQGRSNDNEMQNISPSENQPESSGSVAENVKLIGNTKVQRKHCTCSFWFSLVFIFGQGLVIAAMILWLIFKHIHLQNEIKK